MGVNESDSSSGIDSNHTADKDALFEIQEALEEPAWDQGTVCCKQREVSQANCENVSCCSCCLCVLLAAFPHWPHLVCLGWNRRICAIQPDTVFQPDLYGSFLPECIYQSHALQCYVTKIQSSIEQDSEPKARSAIPEYNQERAILTGRYRT